VKSVEEKNEQLEGILDFIALELGDFFANQP
jgi:uncharacterized protein (DUF2164 family)